MPGFAQAIALTNTYAYVADIYNGLHVDVQALHQAGHYHHYGYT